MANKNDVVKLLREVRGHLGHDEVTLTVGMIGVVVDKYPFPDDDGIEVEFIREGRTVGFATLHEADVEVRLREWGSK